MNSITPWELQDLIKKDRNLFLLDVRTPAEHGELHVPNVKLAPLDGLIAAKLAAEKSIPMDQPLYIFCRTGNRAKQAAEKLEKGGYKQCFVVEGGILAWVEAGFPVTRGGGKVISLERQVRIGAGAIVLASALLAHFLHPAFIGLAGFVGAGLIFAGATDWCGMGMILAKMPWNQRAGIACKP